MPYSEQQKKEHIRELQRYLHGIDMSRGKLPTVIPDGIYGERTIAAISDFQRNHGLPVNGETDSATWELIVREYLAEMGEKPLHLSVFPSSDYVCHKGCGGIIVCVIQSMLAELGRRYDNLKAVEINGDYTEETSEAVKLFQRICGLEDSGSVDSTTWNLLIVCIEHRLQ